MNDQLPPLPPLGRSRRQKPPKPDPVPSSPPNPSPVSRPEAGLPPLPPVTKGPSAVRRLLARVRESGWPALVVGLVLIGGALGYLVLPPTVDQTVRPPSQTEIVRSSSATMPALSGMSEQAARIALQDAGVDGLAIKTITQAAAGAVGTVLAQDPVPGVGVQGTVYLTVSSAVPTPKLAGLDYRDATATVEGLGGVVRLEQVIAPGSPAGTVLGTVPGPGKSMTAVTVLKVADPGTEVALADISASDSYGCSSTSGGSSGSVVFANAVYCDLDEGESYYAEYSTGGVAARFTAKVGLNDDYGPGTGSVRFIVDGVEVAIVPINRGAPQPVSIPLSGKNLLRIEVRGRGTGADSAQVLIGDAAMYALPEQASLIGGTP